MVWIEVNDDRNGKIMFSTDKISLFWANSKDLTKTELKLIDGTQFTVNWTYEQAKLNITGHK